MVDWQFLSLNKLTPAQYRDLFNRSGLKIESARTNVGFSQLGNCADRWEGSSPGEIFHAQRVLCSEERPLPLSRDASVLNVRPAV